MRLLIPLCASLVLAGQAWTADTDAAEAPPVEVDLELVLAVDVSLSMDEEEQRLQRLGYIDAIRSDEVLSAIRNGLTGRIAVTYVEWAGSLHQETIADWTIIDGPASARRFAAMLAGAPFKRVYRTAIGSMIYHGVDLIEKNAITGLRRAIDISGDGPNNQGPEVIEARDYAVSRQIVINGLPISLDQFRRPWPSFFDANDIADYYEHCVIGGPGAFIIQVGKRETIGSAVKRKLVTEIAGIAPPPANPRVRPATGHKLCTIGEWMWRKKAAPGAANPPYESGFAPAAPS